MTHTPLPYRTRADLFTHLAAMEKAGLPIDKAFGLLRLPAPAQPRLTLMRSLLAKGREPALAGAASGLFTRLEASLLQVAMSAGSPAKTYLRLADNYARRAAQANAIKSRMALPVMVLMIALFVQPLPNLVSGALSVGGYLIQVFRPLIGLGLLAWLVSRLSGWLQVESSSPLRRWLEALLPRLPIAGAIHVRSGARDFFESLALMLEAGLPIFDAVPKALETIGNRLIRQDFARIVPRLKDGTPFAEALAGLDYLGNPRIIAFVQTGEGSGTLPEMLFRHANDETREINQSWQQIAEWLPRLFYAAVAAWIAYGILHGASIGPKLPSELALGSLRTEAF